MDICVVSTKESTGARAFDQFARARGCTVNWLQLTHPVPRLTPTTAGLVFFDDADQDVVGWLSELQSRARYLAVPLIAVAARPGSEDKERLIAAGAATVCDPDAGHEQLFQELQSRREALPVLDDIRNGLLEPFEMGVRHTLQEMAGTEIEVLATYQKSNYRMFGDITAVLGLIAATEGAMALSVPEATATALVQRVMSGVGEALDRDMICDCVGEIANVIGGQAKTMLAGTPYHFRLSTPTIVSGGSYEIRHKPGMPCMVMVFGTDVGNFALQICLNVSQ